VDEYYLTVAEVAELLRLNQQTVRNWIDQGSLPALRVGRRVRIKRSDLDRLLSDGYRGGSHSDASTDGPSAEDFWGGEPVGVAEPADAEVGAAASTPEPAAASVEPIVVSNDPAVATSDPVGLVEAGAHAVSADRGR
jgi:excisionase family DNA binding protein